MKNKKLVGIILLVAGVGLGVWGFQVSGSIGSQLSSTLTGSPTDKVMILYIAGAACFVAGLFLVKK